MHEIEATFQEHSHSVNRRILLALLTQDSEKLFTACEKDPEMWFKVFQYTASTIATYKRVLSVMNSAHARLMVALCGVDFDDQDAPFSKEEFFAAIDEAKAADEDEDAPRSIGGVS